MKVLVVGGGGREHVLAWKIAQSEKLSKLYCAPGNAGTAEIAENVAISAEDIDGLLEFAENEQIDLTVVGPEVPLVAGIADKFNERGLKVFGPSARGAYLEGSKAFSKQFMDSYGIPTAKYIATSDLAEAMSELTNFQTPIVVKADGLAAGKGVLICQTINEAQKAIKTIMEDRVFGGAGDQVVIEEFLTGIEASLLCFVDGNSIIPMESARDYKKAYDNDEGLNTGGMGTFSPNPIYNESIKDQIKKEILDPFLKGMQTEKIDFRGVLFIGLMIDNNYATVLEFNTRFGDPEAQVVLPRLESDLIEVIEKVIANELQPKDLKWSNDECVTVIAASGGYPGNYEKGKLISGLNDVSSDVIVFHAGTELKDGKVYTNGGRVLAVTASGKTIEEARKKVYDNIPSIKFEGMFYRTDIADV